MILHNWSQPRKIYTIRELDNLRLWILLIFNSWRCQLWFQQNPCNATYFFICFLLVVFCPVLCLCCGTYSDNNKTNTYCKSQVVWSLAHTHFNFCKTIKQIFILRILAPRILSISNSASIHLHTLDINLYTKVLPIGEVRIIIF